MPPKRTDVVTSDVADEDTGLPMKLNDESFIDDVESFDGQEAYATLRLLLAKMTGQYSFFGVRRNEHSVSFKRKFFGLDRDALSDIHYILQASEEGTKEQLFANRETRIALILATRLFKFTFSVSQTTVGDIEDVILFEWGHRGLVLTEKNVLKQLGRIMANVGAPKDTVGENMRRSMIASVFSRFRSGKGSSFMNELPFILKENVFRACCQYLIDFQSKGKPSKVWTKTSLLGILVGLSGIGDAFVEGFNHIGYIESVKKVMESLRDVTEDDTQLEIDYTGINADSDVFEVLGNISVSKVKSDTEPKLIAAKNTVENVLAFLILSGRVLCQMYDNGCVKETGDFLRETVNFNGSQTSVSVVIDTAFEQLKTVVGDLDPSDEFKISLFDEFILTHGVRDMFYREDIPFFNIESDDCKQFIGVLVQSFEQDLGMDRFKEIIEQVNAMVKSNTSSISGKPYKLFLNKLRFCLTVSTENDEFKDYVLKLVGLELGSQVEKTFSFMNVLINESADLEDKHDLRDVALKVYSFSKLRPWIQMNPEFQLLTGGTFARVCEFVDKYSLVTRDNCLELIEAMQTYTIHKLGEYLDEGINTIFKFDLSTNLDLGILDPIKESVGRVLVEGKSALKRQIGTAMGPTMDYIDEFNLKIDKFVGIISSYTTEVLEIITITKDGGSTTTLQTPERSIGRFVFAVLVTNATVFLDWAENLKPGMYNYGTTPKEESSTGHLMIRNIKEWVRKQRIDVDAFRNQLPGLKSVAEELKFVTKLVHYEKHVSEKCNKFFASSLDDQTKHEPERLLTVMDESYSPLLSLVEAIFFTAFQNQSFNTVNHVESALFLRDTDQPDQLALALNTLDRLVLFKQLILLNRKVAFTDKILGFVDLIKRIKEEFRAKGPKFVSENSIQTKFGRNLPLAGLANVILSTKVVGKMTIPDFVESLNASDTPLQGTNPGNFLVVFSKASEYIPMWIEYANQQNCEETAKMLTELRDRIETFAKSFSLRKNDLHAALKAIENKYIEEKTRVASLASVAVQPLALRPAGSPTTSGDAGLIGSTVLGDHSTANLDKVETKDVDDGPAESEGAGGPTVPETSTPTGPLTEPEVPVSVEDSNGPAGAGGPTVPETSTPTGPPTRPEVPVSVEDSDGPTGADRPSLHETSTPTKEVGEGSKVLSPWAARPVSAVGNITITSGGDTGFRTIVNDIDPKRKRGEPEWDAVDSIRPAFKDALTRAIAFVVTFIIDEQYPENEAEQFFLTSVCLFRQILIDFKGKSDKDNYDRVIDEVVDGIVNNANQFVESFVEIFIDSVYSHRLHNTTLQLTLKMCLIIATAFAWTAWSTAKTNIIKVTGNTISKRNKQLKPFKYSGNKLLLKDSVEISIGDVIEPGLLEVSRIFLSLLKHSPKLAITVNVRARQHEFYETVNDWAPITDLNSLFSDSEASFVSGFPTECALVRMASMFFAWKGIESYTANLFTPFVTAEETGEWMAEICSGFHFPWCVKNSETFQLDAEFMLEFYFKKPELITPLNEKDASGLLGFTEVHSSAIDLYCKSDDAKTKLCSITGMPVKTSTSKSKARCKLLDSLEKKSGGEWNLETSRFIDLNEAIDELNWVGILSVGTGADLVTKNIPIDMIRFVNNTRNWPRQICVTVLEAISRKMFTGCVGLMSSKKRESRHTTWRVRVFDINIEFTVHDDHSKQILAPLFQERVFVRSDKSINELDFAKVKNVLCRFSSLTFLLWILGWTKLGDVGCSNVMGIIRLVKSKGSLDEFKSDLVDMGVLCPQPDPS